MPPKAAEPPQNRFTFLGLAAAGLAEPGLAETGLAEGSAETRDKVLRFLAGMVGESDREHVLQLVARGRINGPHL